MPRKSGRATKAIGEAGRKGDDVRSDLHVTAEVSNSGGLEIEIASKVAAFYGSSIRQLAERLAQSFGELSDGARRAIGAVVPTRARPPGDR
jgi:hypothetical protein